MSIKIKMLIPVMVLAAVIATGILISVIILFSDYVNSSKFDRVTIASDVAEYNVDVLLVKSQSASLYMSENREIIDAIERNDRESLLTVARQIQNEASVEFCTILDASGVVILRTHEPDNFGDSLASQANVSSAMAGRRLTTIEQGTAIRLSIRSGTPIFNSRGDIIGIVSTGYRLDTELFVDTIKDLQECEVTVFLGEESISSTVYDGSGGRVIGLTALEEVMSKVYAGENYIGQSVINGRSAISAYRPLIGPDGQIIAMLSVGYYTDDMTTVIMSFVITGLIVTAVFMVIAFIATLVVTERITKPLRAVTTAAAAIAIGDIELEGLDSGTSNTKDETVLLERAFSKMIASFKKQAYVLARIAEGDYTSKVDVRSEKDVINLAIELTLDSTLSVLEQVSTAGMQVAEGSKQVAQGAQALAQGTAEQAATVQELSASLGDIANKTKNNSEMAGKASALANEIKKNAEKGTHQMDEMIAAVKDINDASQSISSIIKTIDNIAFQTNILALNAAVEAARAGQHGKGFAVVAEEVRNLAAKSAEAAKDTSALISNSTEKAELGLNIAENTANSFTEIVSGINESTQIVAEIATSADEQSRDIEQVNKGIDQVAQVVHQNSATSQESAAASEQMSSQSVMLEELIRQFHLRSENAKKKYELPPKADD